MTAGQPLLNVRISRLTIEGLKNVRHGKIDFHQGEMPDFASVTAIFGQNGSGKTTVIDACRILRSALSGAPLAKDTARKISAQAREARLTWGFTLSDPQTHLQHQAEYSFVVRLVGADDESTEPTTQILEETLRVWERKSSRRVVPRTLISVASGEPFAPEAQVRALTGGGIPTGTALHVAKERALEVGASFVFSPNLMHMVENECLDLHARRVLLSLQGFGRHGLFSAIGPAPFSMSFEKLLAWYRATRPEEAANKPLAVISPDAPFALDRDEYDEVAAVLERLSLVLEQLVPGARIELRHLNEKALEAGGAKALFQISSVRNGAALPLAHESDGMRRILSLLPFLLIVFHDSGATLAVDELDRSIFEYLYGEILRLFAVHGQGQIIFTSQDLRPLDMLDPGQIVCTTTDPCARYVRARKDTASSTLRSAYLRNILLRSSFRRKDAPLYERTSTHAMSTAFVRACLQNADSSVPPYADLSR